MQIPITDELRSTLQQIIDEKKTEHEWADIESDDMFQSERFTGGFDATERAFCFSLYDDNGAEYWFQLTLREVTEILDGRLSDIEGRPAE